MTKEGKSPAVIDVEGVIGVPEAEQFKEPGDCVSTYETFRKRLEEVRGRSAGKLTINIRSVGGNVNDALLIHDALVASGMEVTTRCYGYVASAATIIAQAASPGYREISSNSLYLIHNSVSGNEGNARSMEQVSELLNQTDRRIAALYAARSGAEEDGFAVLMAENGGNGRWLAPAEVLEAGLADRIIAAAPLSNDAGRQVEQLGLPEIPLRNSDARQVSGENEVNNQISKGMNIKKKWTAMLEVLGLAGEREPVLGETELDRLNEELALRGMTISRLSEDGNRAEEEYVRKVDQLRNRVTELEVQNARLQAQATQTRAKEDPSVHEFRSSANGQAYSRDLESFR